MATTVCSLPWSGVYQCVSVASQRRRQNWSDRFTHCAPCDITEGAEASLRTIVKMRGVHLRGISMHRLISAGSDERPRPQRSNRASVFTEGCKQRANYANILVSVSDVEEYSPTWRILDVNENGGLYMKKKCLGDQFHLPRPVPKKQLKVFLSPEGSLPRMPAARWRVTESECRRKTRGERLDQLP